MATTSSEDGSHGRRTETTCHTRQQEQVEEKTPRSINCSATVYKMEPSPSNQRRRIGPALPAGSSEKVRTFRGGRCTHRAPQGVLLFPCISSCRRERKDGYKTRKKRDKKTALNTCDPPDPSFCPIRFYKLSCARSPRKAMRQTHDDTGVSLEAENPQIDPRRWLKPRRGTRRPRARRRQRRRRCARRTTHRTTRPGSPPAGSRRRGRSARRTPSTSS